jgi:hypothetical protein
MRWLLALLVIAAVGVQGAEIIPLSEVRPGMAGFGLTVVAGEEIAPFGVMVVDVLDEPGEVNDFIVIRAFGEAIERSGGIAQGMSGSPIYLEGRLAGALSRAAPWSAEPARPLGLVTPIEPMLAVLAEVQTPSQIEAPQKFRSLESEQLGALSAPVMASGLSERPLEVLRRGLDLRAFPSPLAALLPPWREEVPGLEALGIPRLVSAPRAETTTLPLVPGAPLGVGLVVGDVTVGALGTVTLAEEGALVAFGHPFLFTGPSQYFLTQARILDTVAAWDAPFKLGALGEVVGGVYADRWAGIAGRTDRSPAGINLSFRISDLDHSRTQGISATMVEEPYLEPLLLYVTALEATDRTLDRIGPGTATVTYIISGSGMPRPLVRRNVFLSTSDIASLIPWEAALIADVLEYNEFQAPGLEEIHLSATVRAGIRAVQVVDLVTDRGAYAPGDVIRFTLHLRTWRGDRLTWEGELPIPADLAAPYVELRAYGGPRPLERGEAPPVFGSLLDLIGYIEGIPSYDMVTVELFAPDLLSELVGEPRLYGLDWVADLVGEAVVYGEVSLLLPLGAGNGKSGARPVR